MVNLRSVYDVCIMQLYSTHSTVSLYKSNLNLNLNLKCLNHLMQARFELDPFFLINYIIYVLSIKIWFLDRAFDWHFLADDFKTYFRYSPSHNSLSFSLYMYAENYETAVNTNHILCQKKVLFFVNCPTLPA